MRTRVWRVASLFSGCGGMDLGCQGGFDFLGRTYPRLATRLVYSMDFDASPCAIHDANFASRSDNRDIRTLSADDVPQHDILTGGFPCQPFSIVAQNPPRLGQQDERGLLYSEMSRILAAKQPEAFVAENVKGLLSADGGRAFPTIVGDFTRAGYAVTSRLLNAADYGIPQRRERVFIVGFRDEGRLKRFKFAGKVPGGPVSLSSVLLPHADVEERFFFSERAVQGMRATRMSELMNKGRAQNVDEPCNTVGAHLAKVSLNSTDPVLVVDGRYRMFTPREVARIQSFPDSYVLPGPKTALYRSLGNAVPPVLMWRVMREVIAALKD